MAVNLGNNLYDSGLILVTGDVITTNGATLNIANISTIHSPYTSEVDKSFINADATLGGINVQIYDNGAVPHRLYTIRKSDTSANTITLLPPIGETINGQPSYVITRYGETVTIIHNGNNWDNVDSNTDKVLSTKGELLTHDGQKLLPLLPGVDGQVLSANSATSTGIEWITGGVGEINTGTNVGLGEGLFRDKTATTLNFKTLIGINGISINDLGDELEISSSLSTETIDPAIVTVLDPLVSVSEIKITSSSGLKVCTLADAVTLGTRKTIVVTQKTGTDYVQVNPTTFINGNNIQFRYLGQSITMVWSTEGWANIGGSGAFIQ